MSDHCTSHEKYDPDCIECLDAMAAQEESELAPVSSSGADDAGETSILLSPKLIEFLLWCVGYAEGRAHEMNSGPRTEYIMTNADAARAVLMSPGADVLEDVAAICLAEYKYWRESSESVALQAMGAMGAAANILCAIQGHRAPWHPKPPNDQAEAPEK